MINASNPSVSNASLPPPLLDQDESSTATGTNTNAAASAQAQGANALSDQGISALEYDANFSTTRDPASADNNQMLMINPNSVNPNATRANVQGQMDGSNSRVDMASNQNQSPKMESTNSTLIAKANANTVPNIPVHSDTYQGREVKLGDGAKQGDRIEGFSQQDKRWAALPYTWAPGVPVLGIGKQEGTWGDQPALRQGHGRNPTPYYGSDGKMVIKGGIGCTATALTNGLRAANPQSGITPANAAKLDEKFISTMKATQFSDLSGQGKQLYDRGGKEGPKIERMDPIQVSSSKGNDIVNKIRQSLQDRNPVLVGFRNGNGDGSIRHSSLAVGYANGQIQILDSETGKVGPMNTFLEKYGYTDAKFDYAYAMSKK
jgi:hypothetical protein